MANVTLKLTIGTFSAEVSGPARKCGDGNVGTDGTFTGFPSDDRREMGNVQSVPTFPTSCPIWPCILNRNEFPTNCATAAFRVPGH
jgi:hypothetical protein